MKLTPTRFQNLLSIVFFFFLSGRNGFAQSTGINYTYLTQSYGSWTANAGASIIPANSDDVLTSFTPPAGTLAGQWNGFYFGSTYFAPGQPIYVSSNGFMSFINPGSSIPTNSLATNPFAIIAPIWDDLRVGPAGNVNWKIAGGNPSRRLIVEWNGMLWDKSAGIVSQSVQVTIYEKTHVSLPNIIEIKYFNHGFTGTTNIVNASGGASIGLSGFCEGDFYSWGSTPGAGAPVKTAETATLSSHPSLSFYYRLTPSIPVYDNCAGAQAITFSPNQSIISTIASTLHSTLSAAPAGCWTMPSGQSADVWFTFTKPANVTNFEIFTDSLDCRGANYKTGIEVYNTACGGAPIACDYGATGPNYMNGSGAIVPTNASSYLNLTSSTFGVPCGSQQYWVRVATDTTYKGYFRFNIRPSGRDCAYATDITSCGLPYTAPTGLSTCNFGNEYDSTNSDCHNSFNKGSDYVFSYTPPVTVCADFHLANTPANSFPALFIYNGCPTSGNCLGSLTGGGGAAPMNFNNVTLATGNTYYFVVEYDSTNITPCLSTFDFSITLNATSPPVYDNCANAPNVPVNTSVSANCTGLIPYYNSCATPSVLGAVPAPTCGLFTDGVTPDIWFKFTSTITAAQPHTINVNPTSPYAGSAQDLCMQIYQGTCGALTPIAGACDDNSSGFNLPALTFIPPATSTVYYIRLWSNDGTQPGNFNICAIVGCTPANDLPCNATNLTLGVPMNGDNACSSGAGEPGIATCWDASTVNTVWYKFTPTFTGNVNIRTRLFSMFDSQIAVYTGTCGPGLVQVAPTANSCNNDITEGCAGGTRTYRHSVLNNFPVSNGVTYYVRVDGRGANTGTFEILVIDALQPLPPVPVQDCIVAQTICGNATFTVADPGYQGIGHYCDLATSPGCFIGERSSAWYLVSIQNPAPAGSFFQFSINPFAGTDYDFFVWRVDGVTNYCSTLNNYAAYPWYRGSWTDTYGPTGVSLSAGSGTTSLCISAVGPAFHPAYPVTGGETFLILVSNWWGNTSGFTMDWLGTPISGVPPVRIWQNSADSVWTTTTNWSPVCGGVPTCANQIAAVITNTGIAPYIAASTTVKDITINAGANLRLAPGITLNVCGDFTNNGTLTCGAGSTIQFTGAAALQQISGTFSFPSNSFPNFWVNKSSGTVRLNTNIYISGNDSIISGIVDNNLKNTYLKGHFFNYNGATSFTNMGSGAGGSTFNFSGAGPQNYTNLVSSLTLNNVTMFQTPASSVTLTNATSNLILGTGGTLTLTAGRIITGSQYVDITNTNASPQGVTAGNVLSYVEGNLRRAIPGSFAPPRTYEFPLGEAVKGYQRVSYTFTTAPSGPYILIGRFAQWGGAMPMPATGPNVTECISANWSCCAPYDHGYFVFAISGTPVSYGTYTLNAYPLSVTNDIGGAPNGYSIMSNQGVWTMFGNCVTPGTAVNPVSRTALTATNILYGITQFVSPLPITLISFDAEQSLDGTVSVVWVTASEINNDHFSVERSLNGSSNFKSIGNVKGFGAGTTSQNHYYSLRDPEQCSGVNYYRLKQVDIDGHFTYSNIVAVRCSEKDNIVSVYPNPSNTKINVSFFEATEGKVSLEIMDMFGNIVSSSAFSVKKDLNNIEIKIEELANGFYYLRLKNADDPGETSRQVKFLKY